MQIIHNDNEQNRKWLNKFEFKAMIVNKSKVDFNFEWLIEIKRFGRIWSIANRRQLASVS